MKKVVVMALVAVLVIAMAATGFAGTVTDPGSTGTTAANNTIDMTGYIGPDGTVGPGGVKTIDVSIPTEMLWAAFESDFVAGSANLTSANHYVEVNTGTTVADVDVTVTSFAQTGGGTLPGTATLALGLNVADVTGTSALANVADLFTLGAGVKIASMVPGDKVNMTVTGSYADTGVFPATAIQPEYEMVLKLDAI